MRPPTSKPLALVVEDDVDASNVATSMLPSRRRGWRRPACPAYPLRVVAGDLAPVEHPVAISLEPDPMPVVARLVGDGTKAEQAARARDTHLRTRGLGGGGGRLSDGEHGVLSVPADRWDEQPYSETLC